MNPSKLDLWRLDTNWKFAADHGQASKPGIITPFAKGDRKNSILMCPCCLKVIHKQPLSLTQNPKELHFLGYGFPLFYNMLHYCYISLFLLILSSSAIQLYLSLKQTCEESNPYSSTKDYSYPCSGAFVKMSRVSPNPDQLQIDRIFRSLAFIGQAFLLVYLRDSQRKLDQYHHERNIRIKDFSVIFKNLPKITNIQKTIKDFIQKIDPLLKIEEIFLIPKIDDFNELEEKKKEIINQKKKIMKNPQEHSEKSIELETQLQLVNLQMLQTCKKIEELQRHDQLISEKAILILNNPVQKQTLLKKFSQLNVQQKQMYFSDMANHISLESAPEPRQIIWHNINYPKYRRWLRVILGWSISIVFLGIATGVFYFLVVFRAESHSLEMLIATLVLIQFFNKYIMKIFLHWFCDLEMPETSSDREFSYACKYAFGMFFTTAVMSVLVQAVIYGNVQFEYGVVEGETIMFFFNAFIVNLLWILHPQYYIHKFFRWWKFGSKNITQKEANQLMEDFPYDMGKRYAEVLETMWFTFLFASLIPFGNFLTLIGLLIYYWVDKYNLLRRSKVENIIGSKLPINAVKLMELTLFWKPLGEIIFDIRLRKTIFPQTWVMLGLSIAFLLTPWNKILDKFFSQKFNISKESFHDVKYQFHETYRTVDPIQRTLALQKFISSQNSARKQKLETNYHKSIPSFLQIRDYQSDIRPQNPASTSRQIRNEQRPISPIYDNFMIKVQGSEREMNNAQNALGDEEDNSKDVNNSNLTSYNNINTNQL